jgi:uncharacterized membrane-anchored protein
MTYPKNPGLLLLAVWLLLTGLIALFGLSFANLGLLMALLALVAGAAILLESSRIFKRTRRERLVGMVLLGIWLLLTGLLALTNTTFEGQGLVMGLLALVAGILVLIGR